MMQFDTTEPQLLHIYYQRQWYPIPIPPGAKGPILRNWQSQSYTPADFSSDANIGLHLGRSRLVDVHLTSSEARLLAAQFLPDTELISGRAGSPLSHYWYTCKDLHARHPYQGPKTEKKPGQLLLEIRAGRQQTLAPPSIHPTGEIIYWEKFGQAALISQEELQRRTALLAITCLLAHVLPREKTELLALGSALWPALRMAHYERRDLALVFSGLAVVLQLPRQFLYELAECLDEQEQFARPPWNLTMLIDLLGETYVETITSMLGIPLVQGTQGIANALPLVRHQQQSTADLAVALVLLMGVTLFHTRSHRCYARFPQAGLPEVAALHSSEFKEWLAALYYQATHTGISQQSLDFALATMQAMALYGRGELNVANISSERFAHLHVRGLEGIEEAIQAEEEIEEPE